MAEDEQLDDRCFSCVSLSDWQLDAASMGAARQVVAVETLFNQLHTRYLEGVHKTQSHT